MSYINPYKLYKDQDLETCSNYELVGKLFAAASLKLRMAATAISEGRIESANNDIIKSQLIIKTLNESLDMSFPISGQLRPLYEYALRRLVEANVKKNVEILKEISDMMIEFRDAWNQALKSRKGSNALKEGIG